MGDETRSRYAQYFVTDLPKFETMEGHHSPPPSWIYPNMFPGINMRVNGMDVSRIVRDPHANPHVHEDHPEIYLAVTGGRGGIMKSRWKKRNLR